MAGYWKSLRRGTYRHRPEATLRDDWTGRLVDDDEVYPGGGFGASRLTGTQFGFSNSGGYAAYGQHAEVIPAMQSAVQLISSTMASLPRRVVDSSGREVASDVALMMNASTRRWSGFDVWEYLVRSALTHGVGYGWIPRIEALGGRARIVPCDPIRSTVHAPQDGGERAYQLQTVDGRMLHDVRESDVLTIYGSSRNDLRGLSPLWAYSLTTKSLNSAMANLVQTLGAGMHLAGVVETNMEVTAEWDLPKLKAFREALHQQFAGARRAGQVPVMPPGFAWKQLGFSAVDAELVKLLELSIEDVARIYRVPVRKLYHLRSGVQHGNDFEASAAEWGESISLRAMQLGESVGSQLLSRSAREMGRRVEFDARRVFAGTTSQRITAAEVAVSRAGFLTPNEARQFVRTGVLPALEDLPAGNELQAPRGGPRENHPGVAAPATEGAT